MPITSIEQTGHIILDNCVLSMLTDFCCANNAALTPRQLLDESQHWLTDQLAILQSFAVDHRLHTTDLVSAEYRPEFGGLGGKGLAPTLIRNMAASICSLLNTLAVDREVYSAPRSLPFIDRRLADPRTGLSDPDLSLVRLALDLTAHGHPVVLLTNDQNLLQFTSWVRTQTVLRTPPINPLLLEGWNCLAYLELIHRKCLISSEQMKQMIWFAIKDTFKRVTENNNAALNPSKGMRIIDQINLVDKIFEQSVEIKKQNRMAVL
jgi:hypothetical protein